MKKRTKELHRSSWIRQTKYRRPKCNSRSESTTNLSDHRWWKPHKERSTRSLRNCIGANTSITWQRNSFLKPPARLEFLSSTRSQKSTPGQTTENLRLWRPNWNNILFCGYIATAYRSKTTILHKGYNWFHQLHQKNKDRQRHNFSSNGCV